LSHNFKKVFPHHVNMR